MVAINPDECIDCGVCEAECPTEAIVPDSDQRADHWLPVNREMSAQWPNITARHDPLPDAESWRGRPDKEAFLSRKPAAR